MAVPLELVANPSVNTPFASALLRSSTAVVAITGLYLICPPLWFPLPLRFYGLIQAEADAASDAPGVLIAAAMRQHTAAFCTSSEEVLSSLGLEIE